MIKVWTDGAEAGLLDRLGDRGSAFVYLPAVGAGRAVSVTMPVRLPSWEMQFGLAPIFEMNLPEGVLRERLRLGGVRHVIAESNLSSRFAGLDGEYTRISISGGTPEWLRLEEAYSLPPEFQPDGVTLAGDPLFLYFTSGTTAKPKLVIKAT